MQHLASVVMPMGANKAIWISLCVKIEVLVNN